MTLSKVIHGDVLDVISSLPHHDCLIADPPDNIGLGYGEYDDSISESDYAVFLMWLLTKATACSKLCWISYNARWLNLMGYLSHSLYPSDSEWEARTFVQTFTFGQNRSTDCGNGYRPILRLRHKDAPIYPEQIKVPSWRQQNGDKRAKEGGKVPLDVWDFPRVVGNSKQRRRWHPTQLNELLIKRIVDFSTQPGDSILDCFSGTGTVQRVAKDRIVTSVELDSNYCERIAAENDLAIERFTP